MIRGIYIAGFEHVQVAAGKVKGPTSIRWHLSSYAGA